MQYIYSFLGSFIIMIGLDYLWIGVLMKGLYTSTLSPIARMKDGVLSTHMGAALVVYVALALSFAYFIAPTISSKGLNPALLSAFIFGILVYAVYEFTNYAILLNWPKSLLLVDTIWGGVLFAITTFIYYWIVKIFS